VDPAVDGRLQVDVDESDGRYHRQELISWWDQERLSAAKVLVVGAGALGNELVKNLALLGVGTMVVIDMDRVENSNLSRCVLFRARDEGRHKAEVVAEAARELNPDVTVIPVVGDVRANLGLQVFSAVDVVLGGLDNREARLHINQCCWKTTTPWVDGAIEGLMGTWRVFVPPDQPCYECTMNDRDHELLAARKACSLLTREQMLGGRVPTTATSASIIAAMQVQEAVKLIHGERLGDGDAGARAYAYNGLNHDSYAVSYRFREECMSHDSYDLAAATAVPPGMTMGSLLAEAQQRMGEAVLDLEHEIVTAFHCAHCEVAETVRRPLDLLTVGAAVCPDCGGARRVELVHSVGSDQLDLLGLTPAELGLPRFDIVTGRSGLDRHHFLLDGGEVSLLELATS
jgi:molybdopterin/thiamine biosynthesis adenylyltransferase